MRRLGLAILLVLGVVAVAAAAAAAHPEPNDVDGDGVLNQLDNCVNTRNGDQKNVDQDAFGDRCDEDADGDTVANPVPYLEPTQPGHDNCPLVPNLGQEPSVDPRFGQACYVDTDGDGAPDPLDNCPETANARQDDYDYDRTGDVCDPDDDEDGEFDTVDNCPLVYNWEQTDLDRDGRGSACDDAEVGTGGGAGANPNDRTPPAVVVSVAAIQRMEELGRSMAVRVRCNEGCAVRAKLTVSRKLARRLRIGRRATTLASGTAALGGAGSTYVFMSFNKAARRLPRGRTVAAALSVSAADGAGNRRTSSRRIRLRR